MSQKWRNGSLAEVAQLANVSTGTVSRVFNNSSQIPPETRSRVMQSARRLGIRPRVGVRNKQIALVTEPAHRCIMGGYVHTLTQYICFALSRQDVGISMITEDRIDSLYDCWFDGVIGIAWEDKSIDLLKTIQNLPVIWLSDHYADFFHTVYSNGRRTGRLVGDFLQHKGHRRIAVIHDDDFTGRERAAGLGEVLMNQDGCPAFAAFPNSRPLHLTVKQVLDEGYTALWVTGVDMKVLEVNWLIQEMVGKKVPEDISLIGFENPGISEFLCPSLTTICSPLREIAEKAVELVLDEDLKDLQRLELPETIIERSSVRDLND